MSAPVMLRHNKVDLALWSVRPGTGRPLLLLHGLGERSQAWPDGATAVWPGPVHALDFTGHGSSSVPAGGGYFCEVLMADVDIVLEHLAEPVTVLGRGLGGYIGLLIAGARPTLVRGVVITDGPGLHGGGAEPSTPNLFRPASTGATPDPVALVELAQDIRPADYARTFAWQAGALSGLDTAVAVAAVNRPPWLDAVVEQPGVAELSVPEALAMFAAVD